MQLQDRPAGTGCPEGTGLGVVAATDCSSRLEGSQTSNAYLLVPATNAELPEITPVRCDGQHVRETVKIDFYPLQQATHAEVQAAREALANRAKAVQSLLGLKHC